jgi:hypothetical protein
MAEARESMKLRKEILQLKERNKLDNNPEQIPKNETKSIIYKPGEPMLSVSIVDG